MNPDLRQSLIQHRYDNVEKLLQKLDCSSPRDVLDINMNHYLLAAMIQSDSAIIAQGVLNIHRQTSDGFIMNSINRAAVQLVSEMRGNPESITPYYGEKVAQSLSFNPSSAMPLTEVQRNTLRTKAFLEVLYGDLQRLAPQAGQVIVDSFMTYAPSVDGKNTSNFPGAHQFSYELLKTLGVPDDVIRLRNREVLDEQMSLGMRPDKFVLAMCQDQKQYDFEYLTIVTEFQMKGANSKAVIQTQDADGRRDAAIYLAKVYPWDQPGLLARYVKALIPSALKSHDMASTDSVFLMKTLIDRIESPSIQHMLIRGLTDNPFISGQQIGGLLTSLKDFQYVRDSGKFILRDVLENAPSSIQAQQLESDLGL